MLTIVRGVSNILTKIAFSTPRTAASYHTTCKLPCAHTEQSTADTNEADSEELSAAQQKLIKNDRSKAIPVETSIRYLNSEAYKTTYGTRFVWEEYRRNHKGLFAPKKTRKTCIRQGAISTGNPCPICRDEYLILDHRNLELIKQFISPHTGEVLSYSKTGLCQKKHLELLVAFERAKDYGLIAFDVPFREYDYSEYYSKQ
ncbi:28S ribosomal protein S18b, mitochondrial [Teleopsis dalmanni]|uniref:28S ribosomal protein S18b, mitochondrial n=1 Tax=Teleopsis dalmanni TaxID=139649 RepID=UPI0018CE0738|nr:28S ribosomal protein S18b, mitochondrial [Teleopsis dalmanni]